MHYELSVEFDANKQNSDYKVVLVGSPELFLSGYNFLNKEELLGRYPVFSAHDPKIYFKTEKANEVCLELENEGYDCKI